MFMKHFDRDEESALCFSLLSFVSEILGADGYPPRTDEGGTLVYVREKTFF